MRLDRDHNSPPLVPVLSQMNPVHTFPPCFPNIHSNIAQSEAPCNISNFYGEELLAPHPTPKLELHPLLAVCDCLFSMQLPSSPATQGRAMSQ